ncbi:MAG: hypothetical protein ACRDOO_26680 [Actinomadura sp.]
MVATVNPGTDGGMVAWFYSLTCRSWAATFFDEDEHPRCTRVAPAASGTRSKAHTAGGTATPECGDLRLTVTPDGQRVELA